MVLVNLLKGVSAVLRNHGGCLHLLPPFSSPSPTSIRCQIKPNKNSRVLGKWEIQPLSQSPLRISLHKCKCTSASVDSSSSIIQETPSSPAGAGGVVDDGVVLKDSANSLDIRVGVILKAWRHEEADSLYVEEVDIGEPQPRIICSGLVNYVPLDHLQDRKVVVLANLKPRNMRGVKSSGMLMAASDASHENVELLVPPDGSTPGERIWFGSAEEKENLPDAATPNQIQKKKIWELVQPHLKTDTSCVAVLGGYVMRTSAAQNLVLFGELDEAFGEEQLTIDFPDRRCAVLLSGSDVRCLDRVIYHRGTGYYWYRVGRTSRTAIEAIRRNALMFRIPLAPVGFEHRWIRIYVNPQGQRVVNQIGVLQ